MIHSIEIAVAKSGFSRGTGSTAWIDAVYLRVVPLQRIDHRTMRCLDGELSEPVSCTHHRTSCDRPALLCTKPWFCQAPLPWPSTHKPGDVHLCNQLPNTT